MKYGIVSTSVSSALCRNRHSADDFVMSFQYKSDAGLVYELLKKRMKHFGLSLEEKKTRLIEFGRFAEANRAKRGEPKPETFDFLGFTHYCSSIPGSDPMKYN